MTESEINQTPGLFHGWKILGLCTACQFVSMGFSLYLLGVFIDPLADAFSASPGQIGSASAILAVSGAVMAPILGFLADKGHTRRIMLVGAVAMTLSFLLLAQIDSLMLAAAICILVFAPGVAMLGMIPTTVMVAQWFAKRRGFAIGITAAGISTGGFVMPPVAAWLLENFGLQSSLVALAGMIALILLPAIWWIAVAKPADIGAYPDGVTEPPAPANTDESESQVPPSGLKIKQLLARKDFWVISVAAGVISFSGILIVTYLTPFARETGMSLSNAALILSLYSVSGIIGKFASGWLCDLLPPRRMLTATLSLAAIGWLPIVFYDSVLTFMLTAFSVGFAMGGLIPVWSTLIAQNFGLENFGRVRGIMSLVMIGFTIVPGPLAGYLRDTTDTYATAFTVLWWILPIGILVSLFVAAPKSASLQPHAQP